MSASTEAHSPRRNSGRNRGYALTLAGAFLGMLGAAMVSLLLVPTWDGDPDVGMANLVLGLAAIGMVFLLAFLGAPLGSYILLRALRQPLAGRTAAFFLALQSALLILTFVLGELSFVVPMQVALPLLGRYCADRSLGRVAHDWVAVGAALALPTVAVVLLLFA